MIGYDTGTVKIGLDNLQTAFDIAGVEYMTAREFCRLYHTGIARRIAGLSKPGQLYAPLPSQLIPNAVAFGLHVWMPFRIAVGTPLFIKNGHRPQAYNSAVNGARRSQHRYGRAADIYPMKSTDITAADLRDEAIDLFLDSDEPIGLGLYAGNVHLDYGYGRRVWGSRKSELTAEFEDREALPDNESWLHGGVP